MSDAPNYQPRTALYGGIVMDSQIEANYAAHLDEQGIAWDYHPAFVDSTGAEQRLPYFHIWDSTAAHYVSALASLPEIDADAALARMRMMVHPFDQGAHLMVVQNLTDHENPTWWPVRATGPDDCFFCWPRRTIEIVRLLAAPIAGANGEEPEPVDSRVQSCRNCGSEEMSRVGVRTDMETKLLVSEPVETRLADVPIQFAAIPASKLRAVVVHQCKDCEFESYEGIIRTPARTERGGR